MGRGPVDMGRGPMDAPMHRQGSAGWDRGGGPGMGREPGPGMGRGGPGPGMGPHGHGPPPGHGGPMGGFGPGGDDRFRGERGSRFSDGPPNDADSGGERGERGFRGSRFSDGPPSSMPREPGGGFAPGRLPAMGGGAPPSRSTSEGGGRPHEGRMAPIEQEGRGPSHDGPRRPSFDGARPSGFDQGRYPPPPQQRQAPPPPPPPQAQAQAQAPPPPPQRAAPPPPPPPPSAQRPGADEEDDDLFDVPEDWDRARETNLMRLQPELGAAAVPPSSRDHAGDHLGQQRDVTPAGYRSCSAAGGELQTPIPAGGGSFGADAGFGAPPTVPATTSLLHTPHTPAAPVGGSLSSSLPFPHVSLAPETPLPAAHATDSNTNTPAADTPSASAAPARSGGRLGWGRGLAARGLAKPTPVKEVKEVEPKEEPGSPMPRAAGEAADDAASPSLGPMHEAPGGEDELAPASRQSSTAAEWGESMPRTESELSVREAEIIFQVVI